MNKIATTFREVPFFAMLPVHLESSVIPACIFHHVAAEEFSRWLAYLKDNGYRTLGIDEVHQYLVGGRSDGDRKIVLTFDDGLRNNWSVVYPLLRKYGMKAVLYVNPSTVKKDGVGPNLDDVLTGSATDSGVKKREKEEPFISWDEARIMEKSGHVTVESHGWQHKKCFTSGAIVDFQRPDDCGVPRYRWLHSAIDAEPSDPCWGAPVYPMQSRFVALRFFDDVGLRKACMEYVAERGGVDFFRRGDALRELRGVATRYVREHTLQTNYEDWIDQEYAIRDMITMASDRIELEMQKKCVHFAYPWNSGSRLSDLWLKELGYKTVCRHQDRWSVNHPGDGAMALKRFEGCWIPSLPGRRRELLWGKAQKAFSGLLGKGRRSLA